MLFSLPLRKTGMPLLLGFSGIVLLLGAGFANIWVLGAMLSPDGTLDSFALQGRIIVFQIFLMFLGISAIYQRHRQAYSLKEFFLICIGSGSIALGILLNEWLIAKMFAWYGTSIKIGVWLTEIALILLGINIIRFRSRFSAQFFLHGIMLLAISLCIAIFSGEIFLRMLGYAPWQPPVFATVVTPGGKYFQQDPALGFTHLAGTFLVDYQNGYSFVVTHLPNTLRVTHPLPTYTSESQKDEIWIFGCSFTYGQSLNDDETYPWMLQEILQEYEVVNFGVRGYSTLQSLIQFKQALEKRKLPRIAVVAYAAFHDERNTFSRNWKKALRVKERFGHVEMPAAQLEDDGTLSISKVNAKYYEWPLMRQSALMHFFEQKYTHVEGRFHNSHRVSKQLLLEFFRLAQQHGVEVIIAGVTPDDLTRDMLRFCHEHGMLTVDMSVDLSIKENTNLPHDGHPGIKAHRYYAKTLGNFLKHRLQER